MAISLNTSLDFPPLRTSVDFEGDRRDGAARIALVELVIGKVLSGVAPVVLPNKKAIEVPLAPLYTAEVVAAPTEEKPNRVEAVLTLDAEALRPYAQKWCEAFAAIPPKQLPRGQRMASKLMQKLPPQDTGNAMVDRGRKIILDKTISTMADSIQKHTLWHLNRALDEAVATKTG